MEKERGRKGRKGREEEEKGGREREMENKELYMRIFFKNGGERYKNFYLGKVKEIVVCCLVVVCCCC